MVIPMFQFGTTGKDVGMQNVTDTPSAILHASDQPNQRVLSRLLPYSQGSAGILGGLAGLLIVLHAVTFPNSWTLKVPPHILGSAQALKNMSPFPLGHFFTSFRELF